MLGHISGLVFFLKLLSASDTFDCTRTVTVRHATLSTKSCWDYLARSIFIDGR